MPNRRDRELHGIVLPDKVLHTERLECCICFVSKVHRYLSIKPLELSFHTNLQHFVLREDGVICYAEVPKSLCVRVSLQDWWNHNGGGASLPCRLHSNVGAVIHTCSPSSKRLAIAAARMQPSSVRAWLSSTVTDTMHDARPRVEVRSVEVSRARGTGESSRARGISLLQLQLLLLECPTLMIHGKWTAKVLSGHGRHALLRVRRHNACSSKDLAAGHHAIRHVTCTKTSSIWAIQQMSKLADLLRCITVAIAKFLQSLLLVSEPILSHSQSIG
mmetsp:Transcript_76005/g.180846  ORF Transcript_76005/g.180846 Transcript_76005/m.180846 type:complete len:274 (-) Transcript_76005:741-1562(-)